MLDFEDLGKSRFAENGTGSPFSEEEVLVSDIRGQMSPAQMVDQKLMALLRGSSLGVLPRSAEGDTVDLRRPQP